MYPSQSMSSIISFANFLRRDIDPQQSPRRTQEAAVPSTLLLRICTLAFETLDGALTMLYHPKLLEQCWRTSIQKKPQIGRRLGVMGGNFVAPR